MNEPIPTRKWNDRWQPGVVGIEIPEIYDGVSIWRGADGSLINRWAAELARDPDNTLLRQRKDAVDTWLIRRERTDWSRGVAQEGAGGFDS